MAEDCKDEPTNQITKNGLFLTLPDVNLKKPIFVTIVRFLQVIIIFVI